MVSTRLPSRMAGLGRRVAPPEREVPGEPAGRVHSSAWVTEAGIHVANLFAEAFCIHAK